MRYSHSEHWKKNNWFFWTLAVTVLFPLEAFALVYSVGPVDAEMKGYLRTRVYQDTKDDSAFEKQEDFDSRLRLENTFKLKDQGVVFTANFEARYEALLNETTENNLNGLLREAYVELRKDRYSLSAGRQTLTWGKLDDVIILDRINPQDYSRFILYTKQERKEPTLIFRHEYFGDSFSLESLFLPFFKASDLRFFGSDWAVYDHLLETVINGNSTTDAARSVLRSIREEETVKENRLDNSQVALRLRSKAGQVDFGVYYMNLFSSNATLREKTPTGNILKRFLNSPTDENLAALLAANPTQDDLTLEKEHVRINVIGLDGETVAGAYGIRGEAALILGQPYLRDDFSFVRKNALAAGLGVDRRFASDLYCNVQFIETAILGYTPLFPDEEFSHEMTSTLSKEYCNGSLIYALKSHFNFSYHDWMLNPKVTYKFPHGFEASLGGFVFEGAPSALYGRYTDQDLVYLEARYNF